MVAAGIDYRPWGSLGLSDSECFLCTAAGANTTIEDVFPRWMQRQLAKKGRHGPSIELPNLTHISPNQIKIPACAACNNNHLSQIERIVSQAFKAGPEAVKALDERTLRIWFGKIAYGTRRNDMRLKHDRTDPQSPMIATKADLEELQLLHLMLQEARDVVHVTGGHSTFFFFRSQSVGCNVCDFDVALPIGWPNPVMLRLGNVTVMGAVDDRGALVGLKSHEAFMVAEQLELHPIQVRALWALLVHYVTLLDPERLPIRFGISGSRLWVDRLPAKNPIGRGQAPSTADKILKQLIDTTDEVLGAHGGAVGLLVSQNGEPRHMPFEHGILQLGL